MRPLVVLCVLLVAAPVVGQGPDDWTATPPRSPEESLQAIQVRAGFRVELAACEPLVTDPIAIAFGPDGTLWVVEMGDYPGVAEAGASGSAPAGGRIRTLRDSDGDGRYDAATVFLDGLNFPTGVMPWRGGVLITCAPEVFFAQDTDGDGRADTRRALYRGFIEGNPQHRVNGPLWGLDNWVHLANGDCAGNIEALLTGHTTDIQGHDFRIRPDQGALELESGTSQFGRCRDDWGNWFGGNASWPIWHCVLEDRYLRRNLLLAPPDPCTQLMFPPAHAPVFPISQPQPRFNEPTTASCLTSACGGSIYSDDLFGEAYANSFFVCEPAHNLVHHCVLHRSGVTFYAARPEEEEQTEFLASRDNWFRPTQVRTGPDGALWVVDMYRLVIEHPDFFQPGELAEAGDNLPQKILRAGSDRGRIYRIVPNQKPTRPWVRLDQADGTQLARVLQSPNGVQRDMAHQLLYERQEVVAKPLLEQIVTGAQPAKSRLQALCALDGLGALDNAVLLKALTDAHPDVRRQTVRLAESRLHESLVQQAFVELVQDPDPAVRLQLASSLGEWPGRDPRAGAALAQLAVAHAKEPMIVAAVLSSAANHVEAVLADVVRNGGQSPAHLALIGDLMQLAVDEDQSGAIAAGMQQLAEKINGQYQPWQFTAVAELLRDWEFDARTLKSLQQSRNPDLQHAVAALRPIFCEARRAAGDPEASLACREESIRLLGRWVDGEDDDAALARQLLSPQEPLEVQRAAATAIGRMSRPEAPEVLLEGWRQHGPRLRSLILDILLERKDWSLALLDNMEAQRVATVDIDALHRDQLILHYYAPVRSRAAALFGDSTSPRLETLNQYRSALTMAGNSERGSILFGKKCAVCHGATDQNRAAGPDLGALTDRSAQNLLIAILDPNRSVEPKYLSYTARTQDGRIYSGLLAQESGASITLVAPDGKPNVLLRRHVQELISTGKSLMPEGLERELSGPQDFADLMAYIRNLQPNAAPTLRPSTSTGPNR